MKIIFRCCERQETISYVKRLNDHPKTTILKKAWMSLQNSVSEEDSIIILHDKVTEGTLEYLDKTCKVLHRNIEVPDHTWEYHLHTVKLIEVLKEEIKNSNDEEPIFLVEDDYIFTPDAIPTLKGAIEYWNGFIVPYDYPDRYKTPVKSTVILGPDRHWRTIDSCTMTVLAKANLWDKFIIPLEKAAPTSNDKVFEEIFNQVPCISPLPGVATHMTAFHHTPYINVDKLWNDTKI